MGTFRRGLRLLLETLQELASFIRRYQLRVQSLYCYPSFDIRIEPFEYNSHRTRTYLTPNRILTDVVRYWKVAVRVHYHVCL